MSKIEAKPCPFCGPNGGLAAGVEFITCLRCGVGARRSVWNTRAESPELASLRQRAEDAEMMLRAAVRHGVSRDGTGVLFWDDHPAFDERLELNSTGLPVLTDEARKALGGHGGA